MRLFLPALAAALALVSCQTTPPAAPDRFAEADTNKDGVLNGDEVSDYFANNIFTERDSNSDGRITKAEWNPEMKAAEAKTFGEIDLDKDGAITLAEAKAHARKSGTYRNAFKEADTNKDGAVTREEATAYYASKEGPAR